jgi:hypothetical protein
VGCAKIKFKKSVTLQIEKLFDDFINKLAGISTVLVLQQDFENLFIKIFSK